MAEYIDRQAVLDAIWPVDPENDGSDGCTVVLKNCIFSSEEIEALVDEIPAADVRPVVHAAWIECDYKRLEHHGLEVVRTGETGLCCSNCRHVFRKDLLWCDDFCPHCGAQMDGGKDNG